MQEHRPRVILIRMRYDPPIFLPLLLILTPIIWVMSQLFSWGGPVSIAVLMLLYVALRSGRVPFYMTLLMVLTLIRPIGIPVPPVFADGYKGEVDLMV